MHDKNAYKLSTEERHPQITLGGLVRHGRVISGYLMQKKIVKV
jgi:hypothetical protein